MTLSNLSQTRRNFLLQSVSAGVALSCARESSPRRKDAWEPLVVPNDWPIARPEDVNVSSAAIAKAFDDAFTPNRLPTLRSMLVARRGHLIAERYAVQDSNRERPAAIVSATKSVVSMLAGVAVQRGVLPSIDISTSELFPELKLQGAAGQITLRHALTMQSGIRYPNDAFLFDLNQGQIKDSVAHILSKPFESISGTQFHYLDATAHLAGAMISRASEKSLSELALDTIFRESNISAPSWQTHRDGRNVGAYGLSLTPRDFLKIADFASRAYNGQSAVLSSEWMQNATSMQVTPNFGDGYTFGYFWWLDPQSSAFMAHGYGGQFAYVMPELELVFVITADPNTDESVATVRARDAHRIAQILRAGILDGSIADRTETENDTTTK